MLAFEVEINGEKFVTAGVEDWSVLNAYITAIRSKRDYPVLRDKLDFSVSGLALPDEENIERGLRWSGSDLKIGDVITIRLVDVANADVPKKRYRCDSKVQESSFTQDEIREMRYKTYLHLKEEFDSENNQ